MIFQRGLVQAWEGQYLKRAQQIEASGLVGAFMRVDAGTDPYLWVIKLAQDWTVDTAQQI